MIISEIYSLNPKNFYPENFKNSIYKNFYDVFKKKLDGSKNLDTIYYKVKKGDTLTNILEKKLEKFNISINKKEFNKLIFKVAKENNIKNPNLIYPGQILKIKLPLKSFHSVDLPVNGVITSNYGPRLDPFTKTIRFHYGVDIAAPIGTPIKSTISGKVIFSGKLKGYGNVVIIKNGDVITKYAHNSVNFVKKGDIIHKGDIIAKVGSTGRSTGPHVHYEVLVNNRHVDPLHLNPHTLNIYFASNDK